MKSQTILVLCLVSVAFSILLLTLKTYYIPAPVPPNTVTITPKPIAEKPVIIFSPELSKPVSNPINISGEIDRSWVFEATFPVELFDNQNQLITQTIAHAPDWTDGNTLKTKFTASLVFSSSVSSGYLLFRNDNPSGLPENVKTFKIPLTFKPISGKTVKLYFFNSQKDPDVTNCIANDNITVTLDNPASPLKSAIEQLISGFFRIDPSYENKAKDFKLKSVTINQGIATLVFDDPKHFASGGSCRVSIISDMISQTARQFSGVKEVKLLSDNLEFLQP